MRVLLDTNVLVSAMLFGGLPQDLVERAFRGEFELVTSDALLDELEGVLRDRFERPSVLARALRDELASAADVRRPADLPRVTRDPADEMVLAAALDGRADRIVTGDKDLLVLGAYGEIAIQTVRRFVDALERGSDDSE